MEKAEFCEFLDHLLVARNVSKNTQKTALNSLVFFYKLIIFHFVRWLITENQKKLTVIVFNMNERLSAEKLFLLSDGGLHLCTKVIYCSVISCFITNT